MNAKEKMKLVAHRNSLDPFRDARQIQQINALLDAAEKGAGQESSGSHENQKTLEFSGKLARWFFIIIHVILLAVTFYVAVVGQTLVMLVYALAIGVMLTMAAIKSTLLMKYALVFYGLNAALSFLAIALAITSQGGGTIGILFYGGITLVGCCVMAWFISKNIYVVETEAGSCT